MRSFSKKKAALVATTALAVGLAGTGIAYAYWTTTGAGTGSATAGAPSETDRIQLVQSVPVTGLYPGGDAVAIMVTAHNPAAFNQMVGQVTVTATYPTNCGATNWALANADDSFGNVGAGKTSLAQSVGTIALNETGVNQDACQGAVPTFSFSSASGA
jgi:hypothetical protein